MHRTEAKERGRDRERGIGREREEEKEKTFSYRSNDSKGKCGNIVEAAMMRWRIQTTCQELVINEKKKKRERNGREREERERGERREKKEEKKVCQSEILLIRSLFV